MQKFCKKCQAETERSARGDCRLCANARAADSRAANPEKIVAASAAWYAANRERKKRDVTAWNAANPERKEENDATWAKANPEKKRIYTQNRRARKLENRGHLSPNIAEKLFKLQRGKCLCCGQPLGDNYHLDHNMPLALGGANEDWNMQLLRQRCNNQKHAKHPIDFMRQKGFLL